MEQFITKAKDFFSTLPSEKEREYEKMITKFAVKYSSEAHQNVYKALLESHDKYEYEAFFTLCTIYRHNKDYTLLCDLINNSARFKKHLSYNHIYIMYLVHSEAFYDYEDLLTLAYRDAQLIDQNSGYLHTFANAFATICEKLTPHEREAFVSEWYDNALDAVNKAISLEPHYAKFYCTKARIYSLNNLYSDALQLIQHCINLESSSRSDYALTIADYHYHRLSIALKKHEYEIDCRLKRLEAQLGADITKDLMGTIIPGAPANERIPAEADTTNVQTFDLDAPLEPNTFSFISYSHMDAGVVVPVIQSLQNNEISIWYDAGIEPGTEWPEEIATHIEDCNTFVVFLTNNSINSAHVRREITFAISSSKKIIAVLLSDVILGAGMRLQLELQQMITTNNFNEKSFITSLSNTIKKARG